MAFKGKGHCGEDSWEGRQGRARLSWEKKKAREDKHGRDGQKQEIHPEGK